MIQFTGDKLSPLLSRSQIWLYKYWENRFKIEENKSPTVRKLDAALRYETNFGQHTT